VTRIRFVAANLLRRKARTALTLLSVTLRVPACYAPAGQGVR
jgi:hypothetical protein